MKVSVFCFKVLGTCAVLAIALSIAGWIGLREIWGFVTFFVVIGGIAFLIGIIASIWKS